MNSHPANVELLSLAGPESLAQTAAKRWLDALAPSTQSRTPFYVALSGGRIAQTFFAAVTRLAQARADKMDPVEFFWSDERCVPPEDPESNFRLANEAMLQPLGIATARVHRIRGEENPQKAATLAREEITRIIPTDAQGQPVLDLLLLGMGEDGHVASLFPGEPAEAITSPESYRAVKGPKPPPDRITLGYSTIAAARQVWVLISGPGKESALRASLRPGSVTPLGRVLRQRSSTVVFTDLGVG